MAKPGGFSIAAEDWKGLSKDDQLEYLRTKGFKDEQLEQFGYLVKQGMAWDAREEDPAAREMVEEKVKTEIADIVEPMEPSQRKAVFEHVLKKFYDAPAMREERKSLCALIEKKEKAIAEIKRDYLLKLRSWGITKDNKTPTNLESVMMLFADLMAESRELMPAQIAQTLADLEKRDLDLEEMAAEFKKLEAEFPDEHENASKSFTKFSTARWLLQLLSQTSLAAYADFGVLWKRCGFARLAVGHKLAAALMMTHAPDDAEIQAPWDAWSLYVPDKLITIKYSRKSLDRLVAKAKAEFTRLKEAGEPEPTVHLHVDEALPGEPFVEVDVFRIWCRGSTPTHIILGLPGGCIAMKISDEPTSGDKKINDLITNYVKGVCLALDKDAVDAYRDGNWGPKSAKRRTGKEPVAGTQYQFSAPVSIDLRDAVKEYLSGKRKGHSSSPSVQFLVRGHWRNQAFGPMRVDRKRIWIEPFWKGPEESRVLLRAHVIRKEDNDVEAQRASREAEGAK